MRTTAGRVRGAREAGLTVWRGVPFAAPPVGRLRFRAPMPPSPGTGSATRPRTGRCRRSRRTSTLTGAGLRTPMSEDCLTLTVARRTGGTEPKPVMVFIYGGAFGIGGAIAGQYRGESLAAAGDVVFVGFNYRVGALGWLDLSAYGDEDDPMETNVGLRDQLAALAWVRDNIAAFGGDPDDVTLFGESAGRVQRADADDDARGARPVLEGDRGEPGDRRRCTAARGRRAGRRSSSRTCPGGAAALRTVGHRRARVGDVPARHGGVGPAARRAGARARSSTATSCPTTRWTCSGAGRRCRSR